LIFSDIFISTFMIFRSIFYGSITVNQGAQMKYEIPREMFKQRLEDRLNFVFVDLLPADRTPAKFENVDHINYTSEFKSQFSAKYPNKSQNVILFSLQKGDEAPAKAANDLAELGYNFVYYYNGTAEDVVLDKGLN
jgi:hypothetical protein